MWTQSFRPFLVYWTICNLYRSSHLAEPLWTDPGLKSGISLWKLFFTSKKKNKKKEQAGNEWSNIFPKSLQARKKPPPPPPHFTVSLSHFLNQWQISWLNNQHSCQPTTLSISQPVSQSNTQKQHSGRPLRQGSWINHNHFFLKETFLKTAKIYAEKNVQQGVLKHPVFSRFSSLKETLSRFHYKLLIQ